MSYFHLTLRLSQQNFFSTKLVNSTFVKNVINKNPRRFFISAATAVTFSNRNTKQQRQQLLIDHPQYQQLRKLSCSNLSKHNDMAKSSGRSVIAQEITKNLTLCSDKPRNFEKDAKTLRLKQPIDKPLVIMLSWLLAKKKNLFKYVQIYTDQGYDVLTVEITPWQLLWPIKGTQLVALDVVKFLENNDFYHPLILHGFSVGGYVWGECMVHMARDMNRYNPILDRIQAQVWDSAADISEIVIGVPKSIFPRNPTLQKALYNYTVYHLKTFHEQATTHYIRSSQIFNSTLVKAPALFFLSKNDLIGAEKSNLSAKENFESSGIKCTWKCWDRSAHVLHYRYHTEEYLDVLHKHLESSIMEKLAEKSRAKL